MYRSRAVTFCSVKILFRILPEKLLLTLHAAALLAGKMFIDQLF